MMDKFPRHPHKSSRHGSRKLVWRYLGNLSTIAIAASLRSACSFLFRIPHWTSWTGGCTNWMLRGWGTVLNGLKVDHITRSRAKKLPACSFAAAALNTPNASWCFKRRARLKWALMRIMHFGRLYCNTSPSYRKLLQIWGQKIGDVRYTCLW